MEVALVIDDVQRVPAGSAGAALLDELLHALPVNGHLVLAGRTEPPVAWSRLAAGGDAVEIREDDLALSSDELMEFARLRGVPLPVLAGVGGWPALAELTAATGHHRAADFLCEEILDTLPAADRRLLAAVAVVGGADDELASALAGRPVALRSLVAGLPLVTPSQEGWYRLHALWAPALSRELSATEVALSRRTAGAVLIRRAEVSAAGELLLDAEAWDDLDELLVSACQSIYPSVASDVLAGWLRRIPAERRDMPAVLLLEGSVLQTTDLASAGAVLRRAAEAFRSAGHLAGEVACLSHLVLMAWWNSDVDAVSALLSRVYELQPQAASGVAADLLVPFSTWVRLVSAELAGDPLSALAALDSVTPARFADEWQGVFGFYRALQYLALGRPDEALESAEMAAAVAAGPALPGTVSLVLTCLHLAGRPEDAIRRLPEMFAVPQRVAQNRVSENALAAVWLAWAGDEASAMRHLAAAESAARGLDTPMTTVFLTAARLALVLTRGNENAGAALAAQLHRACRGQPSVVRIVHLSFLAVQYVLDPNARAWWDQQSLAGCFRVVRMVARRLLDARAGRPVDRAALPAAGVLRAFLPPPWVVELAGDPATRPDCGHFAAPRTHVELLGPVSLCRDGIPVASSDLRRQRVRELLAFLVLNRNVPRSVVAAELWPDLDEAAAARNLRVTLTYLARLLGSDPGGALVRIDGRVGLNDEQVTTNLWAFEKALERAGHAERQRAPSAALHHYREALEQYRGPLLAGDAGPDWLEQERDRLAHQFVAAAVRAGELLLADRATEEPLRLARRALEADPWSEAAHQLMIATHLAAGDMVSARVTLTDCERMLQTRGTPPDARTRMFSRRVRGQGPQTSPAVS